MNHISKGMFIPNNVERDSAIRMSGLAGQVGDSISQVRPVAIFQGSLSVRLGITGSRTDGLAPLCHSLVVTAITGDQELIDDLLAEPTLSNVYRRSYPTYYAKPDMPHDGFLADS